MKILSRSQVLELENEVINKLDISSVNLISLAADAFVKYFIDAKYDINNRILIYAGSGKNGADAVEIAKRLVIKGFIIKLILIETSSEPCIELIICSADLPLSIDYEHVSRIGLREHIIPEHSILIDGIFGTGLNRHLEENLEGLILQLNMYSSIKIAIDIPTGIFADSVSKGVSLTCDHTVALGTLKMAYFLDQKENKIGQLSLAPIAPFNRFLKDIQTDFEYINSEFVRKLLKPYNRLNHKYNAGSCLIVGGTFGKAGCILLAGKAALRTGCGLVTLHVPGNSVSFLQGAFPEALIDPDINPNEVTRCSIPPKINSIAIGPGMGLTSVQSELLKNILKETLEVPKVIDADALTLLSQLDQWEKLIPLNSIITPHQGEFDRLFGTFNNHIERIHFMKEFSFENKIVIVLKGADTVISAPSGKIYFNNTANSGMATGGAGDVLTGMIASLLAQGYDTIDAAKIGVFLHGTAGNIAKEKFGFRSLIASDIIDNIGQAYLTLD